MDIDITKRTTFCMVCGFPNNAAHDKEMKIDEKSGKPYCAQPGVHKVYEEQILVIWREAIEKEEGWPIGEGISLTDALQVEHIELIGYVADLLVGTDGKRVLVIGMTYLPWAIDITWLVTQTTKDQLPEVYY